jgi:adenylate cyclase
MHRFPQAPTAVRCGLELVEKARSAALPPARVGINCGPLIVRDGDYFGRTVNLAARIADYARPTEVLVTSDVASHCAAQTEDGFTFAPIGSASLKGIANPVPLFLAREKLAAPAAEGVL